MSNLEYNDEFEALLDTYMPVKNENETKRKVSGKIIGMDRNYTYIDIPGEPLEARVKTEELNGFKLGDEIEVLLLAKTEENETLFYIASKKRLDQEDGLTKLKEAFEKNQIIRGTITKKIKGGFAVEMFHHQGFLPTSLSEISNEEADSFIGKDISLMIKELKTDKKGTKILLSRKEIIAIHEMEALDNLKLGQIVKATITDILDFGLTVKTNGIKGFIHISEIDWKKTTNLKNLFKIGEEVEAKIIEIEKEKRNLKLSIKELTKNPWEIISEKYSIGETVEGKVTRIVNYGAFVELMPGVEGLLHSSDFSWVMKKVNVNSFVKVGDIIKVSILELDKNEKKLKLGLKQLSENPWDNAEEKFAIGKVLSGKVVDVKNFGMFVQIEENVDCFIHSSDFAWTGHKKYNLGDIVEFEVIELDIPNQKIKGSIKKLTKSPWEIVLENYSVGQRVEKPIKNILDFGMFVKLEEGVDGFIPTQLASKDFIKSLKDKFNVGDLVTAEIIEMDNENHKVKLSIKKIELEKAKQENKDLIEKYGISSSEKE